MKNIGITLVSPEDLEHMGAAFETVRQSGLFNMVTESTKVGESIICLLTFWGCLGPHTYLTIEKLSRLGGAAVARDLLHRYKVEADNWISVAEGMPYSEIYYNARLRNNKLCVSAEEAKRHKGFEKMLVKHGSHCAALVMYASNLCFKAGEQQRHESIQEVTLRGALRLSSLFVQEPSRKRSDPPASASLNGKGHKKPRL